MCLILMWQRQAGFLNEVHSENSCCTSMSPLKQMNSCQIDNDNAGHLLRGLTHIHYLRCLYLLLLQKQSVCALGAVVWYLIDHIPYTSEEWHLIHGTRSKVAYSYLFTWHCHKLMPTSVHGKVLFTPDLHELAETSFSKRGSWKCAAAHWYTSEPLQSK